jgi:SAM-dependent MidA family methyltransferase
MNAALYDPVEGYYNRSDLKRWGREGDYRTSPERSQLFNATFARYFAKLYDELQTPAEWTIVEAGGGRGDFAAGVLRTLQEQFPQVFAATRFVPIETNEELEKLSPINPGVFFSNELLDAFPVHRLLQDGDRLAELYVDVDTDGKFVWSNGPLSIARLEEFCREYSVELENNQIIEVNLEIDSWLARVAEKLKAGYLITVDYGAESCDLYDVALRPQGTLRGFSTVAFAPQDKFLLDAGLVYELERELTKAATAAGKLSLSAGAREMILPGGMASSFQVLVQKIG